MVVLSMSMNKWPARLEGTTCPPKQHNSFLSRETTSAFSSVVYFSSHSLFTFIHSLSIIQHHFGWTSLTPRSKLIVSVHHELDNA